MLFGEGFEIFHTVPDHIRRNREPESLGRHALRCERHFRGADSDQSPRNVDHRTTAIAGINRCVGLHQVLIINVADADVTLGCAQHPATDRAAIADGIANHEHGFA